MVTTVENNPNPHSGSQGLPITAKNHALISAKYVVHFKIYCDMQWLFARSLFHWPLCCLCKINQMGKLCEFQAVLVSKLWVRNIIVVLKDSNDWSNRLDGRRSKMNQSLVVRESEIQSPNVVLWLWPVESVLRSSTICSWEIINNAILLRRWNIVTKLTKTLSFTHTFTQKEVQL